MPRKRHQPEEIVVKLRQMDVLTSQGQSVADAVRSIGVTEVAYYRQGQVLPRESHTHSDRPNWRPVVIPPYFHATNSRLDT